IKNIPKAKVIHVASHLIVDTINPLKSNLIFQPSKNQSYFLSIDDIKKLSINAQLITLAACKSNFGKTNFGEGLLNFPWSFYFAGARNILTTKWNASDKTTDNIIAEFYTNLRKGKSKSEAIQKAKIKYLATTDAIGAQPFFWANFALNGDASSINIAPSFLEKFWWLPILFLLFMFFINFQLKRK
ncbi:MAG: CHAT domain-containing protein, partial [Chitinophagales bacterium]|nr:CHAT domain-containing protein [Chitinophagales bacterium]